MEEERDFEDTFMVEYDQHLFVSLLAQENYYSNLIKQKLFLERCIALDKVDEMLPNFYQRLLDHDTEAFKAMVCEPSAWLALKLCSGKNFPWYVINAIVLFSHLTAEARIWMSIVCSRIYTSGNISKIFVLQALIVACALNDIPLNVGHLIVNEFQEFKFHDSLSLIFPSLITKLYKHGEVEVLPIDNWVEIKNQIFPLKIRGEGAVMKRKKRKTNSGQRSLEGVEEKLVTPHFGPEEDGDEPTTMSDDGGVEDNEATESEKD
ncbi:hypothetical protein RDI58_029029 [Solanum bulbocastanum]|uniref:Putative plant transposon protein domain-containing protein n=1 Tax=Solanum bulbocastanum TaxID=147425 RepID=A0AAN8SVK9_SOLBU